MNIDYTNQTALVTGSSKGIGYSCAEVLARTEEKDRRVSPNLQKPRHSADK